MPFPGLPTEPDITMRLTIERLSDPSAQDLADLKKIWPETPAEQYLNSTNHPEWYVARFNQRLLAGLELQVQHQTGNIRRFMVREATRRRGVGYFLLEETLRMNPAISHWEISTAGFPFSDAACLFLQYCGFQPQHPQCWSKTR